MLNIIFGQSKYYVDNLSENTKRGMREKLRRGEYPGFAPIGYMNNLKTHSIEVDLEAAPKVREIFSLYATGRYSIEELKKLAAACGLASRRNRGQLAKSNIERLLKNPFYYGAFTFNGELFQGVHAPLITKELFDKAQSVLSLRGKPRKNAPNYHVFRGFIQCGECGGMITSEVQKQKYIYYRCSRKKGVCHEPFLREEALVNQISDTIATVAISDEFKAYMHQLIAKESGAPGQNHDAKIKEMDKKLDILLDAFLNQVVNEDEYKQKKAALLNSQIALKESITRRARHGERWLELSKDFLTTAGQAAYVAKEGSLEEKRTFIKKIGSNFRLAAGNLALSLHFPYSQIAQSPTKENWGG